MSNKVSIPGFYNGKSVFVTGGMGFLGKVIVEKLLRSCPGIENVYLLVRAKQGKSVNDRRGDLISSPPFAPLREQNPKVLEKIVMIEGDVSVDGLGISDANWELLSERASIFINSAATISFIDPLEIAMGTNYYSVEKVMNLARNARKCDALVHVSTAYTNWYESDSDKVLVKEQLYPSEFRINEVISRIKKLIDDKPDRMLKLLGKHTNTYTFTKNLAEHLLVSEGSDLPVAIIRPTMVMGSIKEPMPGWIDSWAGPTGYAHPISRGLLRSFHIHENNVAEVVPVDMTVNLIIASAWSVAVNKSPNQPLIYHSSTGANPINWKVWFDMYEANARKYPVDDVVWYPRIRLHRTNFATKLDAFITQYIAAYLIDFASILAWKKPKMVRLQQSMYSSYNHTKFSATCPIRFECKNYATIIDSMSPSDAQEFDFDVKKIDWKQYGEDYFLGSRKYLWKSTSTDFAAGRRKIMLLKYANYCLVGSTLLGSLFLLNKARLTLKGREEQREIN